MFKAKQLNIQKEKLVSFCVKNNIVPIAIGSKVGMYRFSLTQQSHNILGKLRKKEKIVDVYCRLVNPQGDINIGKKIGFVLRSDFPEIKCSGGFEQKISPQIFKSLYHLDNDNDVADFVRRFARENSRVISDFDSLIVFFNSEYSFKYECRSMIFNGESKLYCTFKCLSERPYLDAFVRVILKYLNRDGQILSIFSSKYHKKVQKNASLTKFNCNEINVDSKEMFIASLLQSLRVDLLCTDEDEEFNVSFGDLPKELLYSYAKHNYEIISSIFVFGENIKLPCESTIKGKSYKIYEP